MVEHCTVRIGKLTDSHPCAFSVFVAFRVLAFSRGRFRAHATVERLVPLYASRQRRRWRWEPRCAASYKSAEDDGADSGRQSGETDRQEQPARDAADEGILAAHADDERGDGAREQ